MIISVIMKYYNKYIRQILIYNIKNGNLFTI